MWTRLDDFADSVGTAAFRMGRLVLCGLLIVAALVLGLAAFGKAKAQAVTMLENKNVLEGLQHEISLKQAEKDTLSAERSVKEYTPANTCEAVATLQTSYGNNTNTMSASVIAENATKTMEELKGYTMADATKTAWYGGTMERYGWRPVNSGAASAETETPILWECVSDRGELLSVATGTYYGEEDRCGNFRIYSTQLGKQKLGATDDMMAGSLVSQLQGTAQGNLPSGLIKEGALPPGYNETARANSGDQSWNGTTVILSAEENAFRNTLSGEEVTWFENLNHDARKRYMTEKGYTSGSGVVDVTGNSNTNAAKDKPLTNDEALKSILGMS